MLVLVPAGFLVLIVMGAIALDGAAGYMGQRQLNAAISSAANDAAGSALSNRSLYRGGSVVLSWQTAVAVTCSSLQAQNTGDLHDLRVWVGVQGSEVEVRATAQVETIFGRALGGVTERTVSSQITAQAETAPGAPDGLLPSVQPVDCG